MNRENEFPIKEVVIRKISNVHIYVRADSNAEANEEAYKLAVAGKLENRFTDEPSYETLHWSAYKEDVINEEFIYTKGEVNLNHLFSKDIEGFERMKQYRKLEFIHLGMKVKVDEKFGRIIGNTGFNLTVCFEGEHYPSNCHPYGMVTYYDKDDKIIKECKEP